MRRRRRPARRRIARGDPTTVEHGLAGDRDASPVGRHAASGRPEPIGGAGEEDRAQQVGPVEQIARRTAEADLAALHEVRAVGDLEGEVDALLDDDDGHAVVGQAAQDRQHLGHDHRGETERELVDEQHPRPALEAHRQGEHLLLAAGQVGGRTLQEPRPGPGTSRARRRVGRSCARPAHGVVAACVPTTWPGRGSRRP